MEITGFRCKNCGGEVASDGARNGVLKCIYCDGVFTVPKGDADPAVITSLRIGESNLDFCRFDDAYTAYRKAASLSADEPEAYFGMALAGAKVQYLKDFVNGGRLQPIVYEITDKSFKKDKNYLKALDLASEEQRAEYEKKASEIDEVRRKFFDLQETGLDYDCFICTKVSDDGGGHTEDSHIATTLYHRLKEAGYKPFYSEEETRGRTGSDYEALILYALYSSESMLLVCTDESYLQTPWVKNEYTRFLKMMREDEKAKNALTFVFDDTPVERLPGLDGKIQGISFRSYDALERVKAFVEEHYNGDRKKSAPALKRKEYGKADYQKRRAIRQTIEKRKLDAPKGGEISVSDRSKLTIVADFLSCGDFSAAIRFCDGLIAANPSNGEAYWYRFLAKNNCADGTKLIALPTIQSDFSDLEAALAATPNGDRRREMYGVLFEHADKHLNVKSYLEYAELPESEAGRISLLTNKMLERAIENRDEELFAIALKTLTDADLYIDMNLRFARKIGGAGALKYYQNVLSVDEADFEAQWYVFQTEVGEKNLSDYCTDKRNHPAIEEKLFSFGFNDYAAEKLIEIGLSAKDTAKTYNILDFVLTMVPNGQEKQYREYLEDIVERLFKSRNPKAANKYNEMRIAGDPYDHAAYFNRCLIKRDLSNPLGLMKYSDTLLEDEDYLSAVNSYTERFPDQKNLYLDIRDALSRMWADKDIVQSYRYVTENVYVEREELLNHTDEVKENVKKQVGDKKDKSNNKKDKWFLIVGAPVAVFFAVLMFLGYAGISPFMEFFYCLTSMNKTILLIVGILLLALPAVGVFLYVRSRQKREKKRGTLLVQLSITAAIICSAVGGGMYSAAKAEKTSMYVGEGYVLQLKSYEMAESDEYSVEVCVNSSENVVIPATFKGLPVTMIGGKYKNKFRTGAFNNDKKLVTLTVPASVKTFGAGSLANCTNLKAIYYQGTQEDWEQVILEHATNYAVAWNHGAGAFTVYLADGTVAYQN